MKKVGKKISVYVGKGDIKNGEPNSTSDCPIACAIRRRGFKGIQAGYDGITLRRRMRVYRVPTPTAAEKFMRAFDRIGGVAVHPFHFNISL
jgi:hypothetical protein